MKITIVNLIHNNIPYQYSLQKSQPHFIQQPNQEDDNCKLKVIFHTKIMYMLFKKKKNLIFIIYYTMKIT